MSRTLFVGNLSSETRRSDLEEICGAYRDVRRLTIPKDPDTVG